MSLWEAHTVSDEIMREAWDIKDAIGKEANYNLHALGNFLRKRQQSQNKQFVDFSAERTSKAGPDLPATTNNESLSLRHG